MKNEVAKPKKSAVILNFNNGDELPVPSIVMLKAKLEKFGSQAYLDKE
jgi:hypothetical protein